MPTSSALSQRLDAVFKAYDVRGLVPEQLDERLAHAVGNAFVTVTGVPAIVVGQDMRPSSAGLAAAFAEGAALAGADVTHIGLASTDQLYFASGHLDRAGAMFTASHNPAHYNGIKLCRSQARPVGADTGLSAIRDAVATGQPVRAATRGRIDETDVLEAYADQVRMLAESLVESAPVAFDRGAGINVARGANRRRDVGDRHVLGMQPAVAVFEMVHDSRLRGGGLLGRWRLRLGFGQIQRTLLAAAGQQRHQ